MLSRSPATKGAVAGCLALVAIVLVLSAQQGDDAIESANEAVALHAAQQVAAHGNEAKVNRKASKASKPTADHVKGGAKLRTRITKALKVASASLRTARGRKQQKAARAAVKSALRKAGVADANSAGTIAWANRNLDLAKKWAAQALRRDATALSTVAAYKPGDRKKGEKMQKKAELAIEAMIAVSSKTKNAAHVTHQKMQQNKIKMASFDGPIRNARKAADYAAKSVQEARAAIAATVGTKARVAAKHALSRAEAAVHDANKILKTEIGRKKAVTSKSLQKEGLRLVGELELRKHCRRAYHRAHRVLKLVQAALAHARKNHFVHKSAIIKQQQKITMEKASKRQAKERKAKNAKRRKALSLKRREQYAATLAKEALKYGQIARDHARKAAAAGKVAARKALESANVKAALGGAKPRSTQLVTAALQRENIAAALAEKAAKMEDAIVTGGTIPKEVEELIMDGHGNVKASALIAASTQDNKKPA